MLAPAKELRRQAAEQEDREKIVREAEEILAAIGAQSKTFPGP